MKHLHLQRKIFCIDTETTGLDVTKDRIIELAFQQFEPELGMTKEYRTLINPGIPIPPAATRVHHITDDEVKDAYSFRQLAPSFAKGFTDCDYAGQNVRYDLRILAAEMARAGVPWSYAGARIIDSSRIEALAVPRHLSDLHAKYTGAPHDGAHGALSDVRAAATVIAAQLETYPYMPRDLGILHAELWPGWIDGDGKFRFVDGVPCFSQWGKYAGQPMGEADSGYWDFILRGTFSADVKALASEAKLGRYPTEGK